MSKRHFLPPPTAQTGPGRSRRQSARQDNVRAAAAWVLERTLQSLAPADSFLDSALPRFDDRDQGLLRELVMGSLRWLRRLDHVIAAASSRSFDQIEEVLRSPLRIATYQLLFLDRVPAHAAVHEAVEQAHQLTHRGGASFVNGVLRRIARDPRLGGLAGRRRPIRCGGWAIEKSHPDFLVDRWLDRFGTARTLDLLDANNRAKPMHLLAFRDRGGRELLAESLIDEGLEVEPASLSPLGLIVRRGNPLASAAFRRGDFYVQDEASQAAALIPPPRRGRDRARRRGGARRQELLPARLRAERPDHHGRRRPVRAPRWCAPTSAGWGAPCRSPWPTPARPPSRGRSTAWCSTCPAPAPARCAATRRSSGGSARARSAACRARRCGCSKARRRWWLPAAG